MKPISPLSVNRWSGNVMILLFIGIEIKSHPKIEWPTFSTIGG